MIHSKIFEWHPSNLHAYDISNLSLDWRDIFSKNYGTVLSTHTNLISHKKMDFKNYGSYYCQMSKFRILDLKTIMKCWEGKNKVGGKVYIFHRLIFSNKWLNTTSIVYWHWLLREFKKGMNGDDSTKLNISIL